MSAHPTPSCCIQVSVINSSSPFARDYDLTHIVAAYQERNGESWREFFQLLLKDSPDEWGCGKETEVEPLSCENIKTRSSHRGAVVNKSDSEP